MQPAPAPRLSIIIATFNAARTLERALASITAQRFTDWELIVIDGGSRDGTQDILASHAAHIAYWHSRPDKGIYDAWNQGLRQARGDYVCFLGADDAWAGPDTLARVFAAIGTDDYDLVTSVGEAFDPATGKTALHGGAWDYRRLGRRMVVSHPGLLQARRLFVDHGEFDSSYRIAGDLEWLLRLPPDLRTLHLDEVTVRIEAAGISKTLVMRRMLEQRRALANCPRFGVVRAWIVWLDKLWRYPVAQLFGIPH